MMWMGCRPVFNGGRLCGGITDREGWVPAWVGGTGGSRTAPTGENVVGHGVHPHPPGSRGQALTFPHQGGRDLQARNGRIFIVMTSGEGGMGPRIREDNGR